MTASEEVRKLLDELGVEHDASEDDTTIFYDVDGNRYTYNVNPESGWAQLYGYNLTPAQAIAATVGEEHEMHICKRCGVAYELNIIDKGFGKSRFCPNCGHRELYQ